MTSIIVNSDPSRDTRTDYTHVTLRNLKQFPWEFLGKQQSLNSLTVIGNYPDPMESYVPRAEFPTVKRLHLKGCDTNADFESNTLSPIMIILAVPNAEYIEINHAGNLIKVQSEHVQELRIRQCFNTRNVSISHCDKLKIIHVDDHLPDLRYLCVENCPKLEYIPIHFRDCEKLHALVIDACPMITSVKTLCNELHLTWLYISNCPLLRDLPLIHPDAAPFCKVKLHGCKSITMDAIPVPWRLIKDKRDIFMGAAETRVNPITFNKVLQERLWNRDMHAHAGGEVNTLLASLLLGIERQRIKDIEPALNPEIIEEALDLMPVMDLGANVADAAAEKAAKKDLAEAAAKNTWMVAVAAAKNPRHHHVDTDSDDKHPNKNPRHHHVDTDSDDEHPNKKPRHLYPASLCVLQ